MAASFWTPAQSSLGQSSASPPSPAGFPQSKAPPRVPSCVAPLSVPGLHSPSGSHANLCVAAAAKKGSKGKTKKYPRGGGKSKEGGDSAEEGSPDTGVPSEEDEEEGKEENEEVKEPARSRDDPNRLTITASEPANGELMVQVKVPGGTTQGVYDKILRELAQSCPPVDGARKIKGGKGSKVDPGVVIRLVGKSRVTGFVVAEVVNSTIRTVIEQKGLSAEKEAKTLQNAEELAATFVPGQDFAFDFKLQLVDAPADAPADAPVDAPVVTTS